MKIIKKGKKSIKRADKSTKPSKPKKSTKPKIKTSKPDNLLTGVVSVNQKGYGFLRVEGYEKDFFIPKHAMSDAYNGDTVTAKRISSDFSNDEVEIISVKKRGAKYLTGVFFKDRYGSFVRPDDKGFIYDIIIKNAPKDIEEYSKVYIEITSFPKKANPEGRIIKVLGNADDLFTEEESILLNKGIDTDFWQNTLSEAKACSKEVTHNDVSGRLDLTNELIFTIDGENSRDFDDAVSLKIADNGNYILGVHIADVSHYVKPHTALDKQAFLRGNSVYLPDKVIPMLPFELSNGICSLNENVERLTLSVIAEIDKFGETVKVNFYKSVIKSSYRLTYTLVQQIIDGDEQTCLKYSEIVPTIKRMNELMNILAQRHVENGEINLSVKESDVFYDNGKITVREHKSNQATKLIEQFMIFANLKVGEYLTKKKAPAVYRVHEKPSEEKFNVFNEFLSGLGLNFCVKDNTPADFQSVLNKLQDNPLYDVVNKVMLRCMQKARYSACDLGHFGLAVNNYLHFTSPIRRYSDLVVHRVLKSLIDGENKQIIDLYKDFCEKTALNCSLLEKKSMEAERDIDSLYKAHYMKDYVGKEFDGIVSGVTSFGVFVELENTVEGIVRLEYLPKGNYEYIENRMELESSKNCYRLGDRVRIGVLGINYGSKRAEFIMLKKYNKGRIK